MKRSVNEFIQSTVNEKGVARAWEEDIIIPTYAIGEEEKAPIFLEKRVYQGSSGSVYPYPVVEKICDEKTDRVYRALFLENEYLKIMVLPALGGRIQMAYDKTRQRHFVYYNQVIKPALVGLTGPWISGGIEFNWPQHHRPSTYLPTDYRIEENPDGSVTVWCSEVERMFRTKGMQGFTLHPGRAYLEIRARVYNRTPFPQTFLWWANPAVVVHDHYHSVFPPDVHAVFDHGKRDVSNFPIATGVYYKQDYSAGVDISKYKNIPVPTSYMAIKSKYDFVGGYEENIRAGLLHVADHHVSPGKKQWTWGCGDFGQAWDRNLTDEDGPYIELMTGVYTDNQPDFTWLQPYEEKTWVQYFMPYSEVGYVKNATKDLVAGLDIKDGHAHVTLHATSAQKLSLRLQDRSGKILSEEFISIDPSSPYKKEIFIRGAAAEDLRLNLLLEDGRELLSYTPEKETIKPPPPPARAARLPKDIASIEQLYLTGLHLEQYRHATYRPEHYYQEALEREPGDVRCNNAMGLLCMRRGKFAQAESYFRKAIETLTERNPNPYDGEALYNLGWSLKMQTRLDEAYEMFFKSAWNAAWQDPAYLALAQIDTQRGDYSRALEKVERSLVRNWHNHKARQLKASILRKLGRAQDALSWIEDSLRIDSFNIGCLFEKYLLTENISLLEEMKKHTRGWSHDHIEYALDFFAAGLHAEAASLLETLPSSQPDNPMRHYALGYFASMAGDPALAQKHYQKAETLSPDRCFPNRIEEVNILRDAMRLNPNGAMAPYYLGNFWYASRQYDDAIACWEKSISLRQDYPIALRNLSLAYHNKRGNPQKALELLEKAFGLDTTDARLFMELDQLHKRMGLSYEQRLTRFNQHRTLIEQRDDLFVEYVTLHNQLGRHQEARELIDSRKFHPWEGGEGKITKQYVLCRVELAKEALAKKDAETALKLLLETTRYPHNLGEGKLSTAPENDLHYYKGLALQMLGKKEEARTCFEQAAQGPSDPQQAFFYNDPQPDNIFYQGLAWRALGDEDRARSRFNKLIDHGKAHLFDECRIDYFAVSLPDLAIWDDDLNKRNQIHCHYVMGLGYLGLGEKDQYRESLGCVLSLDINHQGAQTHLKQTVI